MRRRRCKTCKWWRPKHWLDPGWGFCALAESVSGEPMHPTKAYAVDHEYWHAELRTHEDFACNQWAARGEAT